MTAIRVGLDGRAFVSPAGGIRRYVHELAHALLALEHPPELVVLGGSGGALPSGVSRVAAPWHPPTNAGWTLVGLPAAARRARVDVIHAPAYTAPPRRETPVVVTVHDVSYARRPEWYPYRADWLRQWFYRRSAVGSDRVLTDSTFSRFEIAAAYGIPESRISVVPLGVDTRAFCPDTSGAPARPDPETPGPYLLHVGDLHPRRNLPLMIDALAALDLDTGAGGPLQLVLAGVDRGVAAALTARAAAGGVGGRVRILGPVSPERLLALYRGATALVYPSRYEGFGLPLLEAMACGTPVIAARAASIPEVVGDAGDLLDPDDPRAWAGAIAALMTDGERRARARAAGLERAAAFPWARTAESTLAVYRAVAGRSADA